MREPKFSLTFGDISEEIPLYEFEIHTQRISTWSEFSTYSIPVGIKLEFGLTDETYKKVLKLLAEAAP